MNGPQIVECSWEQPVKWFLFPQGVYIDGGTLDLGIVRDSALNSTNDFQIFGESFGNASCADPNCLFTIDLRD